MAKIIESLSEMEIVGLTEDLPETFTLAEALGPDVVIVAEEFCRMDEWAVMRSLFFALNSAWIVSVSDANHPAPGIPDLLPDEPLLDLFQQPEIVRDRLRQVQAIKRHRQAVPRAMIPSMRGPKDNFIVVMGASTGGVDTLLTILSSFPEDCPPTAIVQHTGRGFSDSLVRLLDRRSKPEVVAATDGLAMARGRVCLAAGIDGHLHLKPGNPVRCQIVKGAPVSGHIPSADVLFRSALPLAPNVLGVILTGMGQDGAAGLLDLRRADCPTLGQDAATSVVFGMPKAAHGMGAVERLLPDRDIAAEIMRICRGTDGDGGRLRRAIP